jgi:hypothetical protein
VALLCHLEVLLVFSWPLISRLGVQTQAAGSRRAKRHRSDEPIRVVRLTIVQRSAAIRRAYHTDILVICVTRGWLNM